MIANTHRLALAALASLLLGGRAAGQEATFHVSPAGRDTWSGRRGEANSDKTDGPLASLAGARDAVRRFRLSGPAAGKAPVRIVVAAGTYELHKPLLLTPADSGTAEAPVVYEAARGARPVFTAGRRITGFEVAGEGLWKAKVPAAPGGGAWRFEQLYVNNRWATRARTPNKFYHYTRGKVGYGTDPVSGREMDLHRRAFEAEPDDLKPLLAIPPEQLRDVQMVLYHSWAVSVHRLAKVDGKTARVYLTGDARWPLMQWQPRQRYHVENYRAALDAPGEWYLGADGVLLYKPLPGEDPKTAEVYAPLGESFLRFAGEPELGLWVRHITFRGLALRHAGYTTPPQGHSDGQSAVTIPAVVDANGARNITIENCEIGCAGSYGVWFHRACRDCRLVKTYLHDLGAGGVKIGHGWGNNSPSPAEITKQITVDNCIIRRGARLFRGAIGVWIGHASDNAVTHNDISEFFYTTISVGWRWGYAPSVAKRNIIRFNHLHHLGWGVMSDMGGVYTLGPSEGTVVSDNHIHHVYSYDRYGRGGWGLYTDEGSSNILFERNLVHHVKTGTFHQHYGRDNVVRNNILAFSMDGQIQRSREENHNSFTFENNLVYWKGGPLLSGQWKSKNFRVRSNLYYEAGGAEVTFDGRTLAQWQAAGHDEGSILADPKFADPDKGDFTLAADSPARKVGFKPFDYTKAGVYGSEDWVALARSVKYPQVEFAPPPPPPPPVELRQDFESAPAGSAPARAQVYTENKGDGIVVTDKLGAGGSRRCLRITDAPGLARVYNPHFYYQPRHTAGVTKFAFDLRLGDGAHLYAEWRGPGHPYKVGPSITVKDGALRQSGGKELMKLPDETWIHVEITAGIGADSDGTWSLAVTLPGREPRRFPGLAVGHKDWKRLDWLGFSSMAAGKTVYYLDNVELTNAKK